jgi:hypothetical protein
MFLDSRFRGGFSRGRFRVHLVPIGSRHPIPPGRCTRPWAVMGPCGGRNRTGSGAAAPNICQQKDRSKPGMSDPVTFMPPDARDSRARGVSSDFPSICWASPRAAPRPRPPVRLHLLHGRHLPVAAPPRATARFLQSILVCGPILFGIGIALLVAESIRSKRLPLSAVMTIAWPSRSRAATPLPAANTRTRRSSKPTGDDRSFVGCGVGSPLTVVVPTTPRRALLAALASSARSPWSSVS